MCTHTDSYQSLFLQKVDLVR
jgi:hypothetical protein